MKYNLVVVIGPTASGKTLFAANLAYHEDGEIISADSRQIYRRMDLGTGKDYSDYIVQGKKIPYHLIDIHEPGYKYNVFEYQKDFLNIFSGISSRNKMPVLCGGTGLYIDAVTKGYKLISVPVNPGLRKQLEEKSLWELEKILSSYKKPHNKTDTDTKKRAIRAIEIEDFYSNHPERETEYPEIKPVYIGVNFDRETRRKRITERLHKRLEAGMIEEVENLLKEGISEDDMVYYGLEYKYITFYLKGKMSYDEMVKKLNTAIHQFAKRQMTWFRKMEKEGCRIQWLDGNMPMEDKIDAALKIIK